MSIHVDLRRWNPAYLGNARVPTCDRHGIPKWIPTSGSNDRHQGTTSWELGSQSFIGARTLGPVAYGRRGRVIVSCRSSLRRRCSAGSALPGPSAPGDLPETCSRPRVLEIVRLRGSWRDRSPSDHYLRVCNNAGREQADAMIRAGKQHTGVGGRSGRRTRSTTTSRRFTSRPTRCVRRSVERHSPPDWSATCSLTCRRSSRSSTG